MQTQKILVDEGQKVLHEFYCQECNGYITVKIRVDLNGAHCIVCPNCGHEHYRIIKNGEITEDRAPKYDKNMDKIQFPKASYSKDSWEQKAIKIRTSPQSKAVKDQGNFLSEMWKRMLG